MPKAAPHCMSKSVLSQVWVRASACLGPLPSSSYMPPLAGCDGLTAFDGNKVGLLRDPPLFDIVIGDQSVEREPQLAAKAPQGFCPTATEFPQRVDFHWEW